MPVLDEQGILQVYWACWTILWQTTFCNF